MNPKRRSGFVLLFGGADFVMHFWDKAAETVRQRKARLFGLITTSSVTQKFSRRVVHRHLCAKDSLFLMMAIPNHPWLKSREKAAVRIAMTVGRSGSSQGRLRRVISESELNSDTPRIELSEERGKIQSDLSLGVDVTSIKPLRSNIGISSPGVKLHGSGFIVTAQQATALGLGKTDGLADYILPYRNGRDLTSRPRDALVIDLYPLDENEVRLRFPAVHQWVSDQVRPQRDSQRGRTRDATEYANRWWQFGKPRTELRSAIEGLSRYIVTVETSKHRFFQFLDCSIRPDNKLICIAIEDAFALGVLSSRIHVAWALASMSRLGAGNDPVYVKTTCFDTFPFPGQTTDLTDSIRGLAEQLDSLRKKVLAQHKQLTMTKLYNVLEKVHASESLSGSDRDIYDAGLVGVLRQIHDDLDSAVAGAYGWPDNLPDEEILGRLVALNIKRADEERRGQIHWLRPEFQAPKVVATRAEAEQLEAELAVAKHKAKKPRLPDALPDQVAAIRAKLAEAKGPIAAPELAKLFSQGKRAEKKVEDVLRTLALLGQAERANGGYLASA